MQLNISLPLLAVLLFSCIKGELVVDLAGKADNFNCLKDNGVSQVIIRAYHSYGAIDTTAQENILKANAAGLATDVYMFPCRGKDPSAQVT